MNWAKKCGTHRLLIAISHRWCHSVPYLAKPCNLSRSAASRVAILSLGTSTGVRRRRLLRGLPRVQRCNPMASDQMLRIAINNMLGVAFQIKNHRHQSGRGRNKESSMPSPHGKNCLIYFLWPMLGKKSLINND